MERRITPTFSEGGNTLKEIDSNDEDQEILALHGENGRYLPFDDLSEFQHGN